MNEILKEAITYILPIVAAGAAYVIAKIDNKKVKERLKTFEEALQDDDRIYYVNCPKCGFKIILNNVKIKSDDKKEAKK